MANKASDLDPLLRLRDWGVDECRRALGLLQTREDQLILYGQELQRQMARESQLVEANPTDAGFFFGAFASDHKLRREKLAITLANVRDEIERARQQLMDAFREREVIEQVREKRLEQERIEANRQEQASLDEIAQNQHRRRKAREKAQREV